MVAGYNSSWPLTGQPRYRPRGTRLLTGMYTIQSILNLYVRVVSVWPFVLIQKELWGRGEGRWEGGKGVIHKCWR